MNITKNYYDYLEELIKKYKKLIEFTKESIKNHQKRLESLQLQQEGVFSPVREKFIEDNKRYIQYDNDSIDEYDTILKLLEEAKKNDPERRS